MFLPKNDVPVHNFEKSQMVMDVRILYWFSVVFKFVIFIRPSRDIPYYVLGYGGRAGIHKGFRTITLVLYIGSLPNLAT